MDIYSVRNLCENLAQIWGDTFPCFKASAARTLQYEVEVALIFQTSNLKTLVFHYAQISLDAYMLLTKNIKQNFSL
jgi:hypothetical protein